MSGSGELFLTCAGVAALLAIVARGAERCGGRPGWTHLLWLLVLLRLLLPPVLPVSMPFLPREIEDETSVDPSSIVTETIAERRDSFLPLIDADPAGVDPTFAVILPRLDPGAVHDSVGVGDEGQRPAVTDARAFVPLLVFAWALGAVALFALGTVRARRFSRSLARGTPAPREIEVEVQRLARAIGLRRAPPVIIIRDTVPPLVWSFFRPPRLVLPAALLATLDDQQRAGVLTHELAHVKRRDHWVRHVEWIATSVWWWFPLVWWARAHLHRLEEECCDAWVLQTRRGEADAYASGLLRAVTWLAESHAIAPAAAVALEPMTEIRRRVHMILSKPVRPAAATRTSWIAFTLVLATWLVRPVAAEGEPMTPSNPFVAPLAAPVPDPLLPSSPFTTTEPVVTQVGTRDPLAAPAFFGDHVVARELFPKAGPPLKRHVLDVQDVLAAFAGAKSASDLAEVLNDSVPGVEATEREDGRIEVWASENDLATARNLLRALAAFAGDDTRARSTAIASSAEDEARAADLRAERSSLSRDLERLRQDLAALQEKIDGIDRELGQTESGESGHVPVAIQVVGPNGEPVANANLRLVLTSNGTAWWNHSLVSDDTGTIRARLPIGEHRFAVVHPDGGNTLHEIDVACRGPMHVVVVLEDAGASMKKRRPTGAR